MSSVTIAVDLAKSVFELAVADPRGRITERKRLSRPQFERYWSTREPCTVVMEACGSAHHWARVLVTRGFTVRLLPAQYVKAYVQRNKTDRADCEALLEAARSPRIKDVAVKSADQQAILALHRAREQWKSTRTARINGMRGLLREFGVTAPVGAAQFLARLPQLLEHHRAEIPARVRHLVLRFWSEAEELEGRMAEVEEELKALAKEHAMIGSLLKIPGIGVLTATALYAAVGDVHRFPSGRHLASWLGITPREHSSGSTRRLGRISKQGDVYLRTLLIHGARSALTAAQARQRAGQPLSRLQQWAMRKSGERHANQAAVALANKLARTAWAVWKHERRFNGNHQPVVPEAFAPAAAAAA
jgi:transposase